ncbi:hypothetical protein E2986_13887 [Frieseomelitta varia]|uniref:Guanylate cyclase domain-containing protein n=1 Tax=Frieseomelitta varia TaxID=561572 RepID=A0A833W7A3_9HYME|nr:hypothetical protein E2986_13887 [Frieseomelitta varia]
MYDKRKIGRPLDQIIPIPFHNFHNCLSFQIGDVFLMKFECPSLVVTYLISSINFPSIFRERVVGGMRGCVNKTSLFDKDLMFLCVFGLRGDKHELESQVGLRCASKLRSKLTAIENIKSVTVGVTTGMTYCGVVGHILRREYTVIGMSVNKAARLMVAYKDKVVCDRESFLHSHLEARHFILQEPRYLKGITNVGPIYEFQEQPKYTASDLVWIKYPLLGRHKELTIFKKMLMKLLSYSNANKESRSSRPKYNTLLIKGEPRIGKTRLLDEFTQNIPVGTQCNYISLQAEHSETPYNLIHLLFSMPLGFTDTSTRKEREDKLLLRLGKLKHPYFLCIFNQLFNVHFSITQHYNVLTDAEKKKLLRKFLLKLMKSCFQELWVVIIDDAEYCDPESLSIFDVFTKKDLIFFVLSIGRKLSADFPMYFNLLHRGKVIQLHGIDRWYHAGLVCQILNVKGLPAELEKRIQEKSLGNPGWIESYLVSLLQVGDLEIIHITKKEARIKGYVLPPTHMLKRFTEQKNIFIKTYSADLTNETVINHNNRNDKWQIYRTSFKVRFFLFSQRIVYIKENSNILFQDSAISLLEKSISGIHKPHFLDNEDDETMIAVCNISESFTFEDIEPEITMDG